MKRIIFAALLAFGNISPGISQGISVTQTNNQQQEVLFAVDNTSLNIINNFIAIADNKTRRPYNGVLPAGDYYYVVSGEHTDITMQEKLPSESFEVSNIADMHIFNPPKLNNTFSVNNTLYRVSINGKVLLDWANITKTPASQQRFIIVDGKKYASKTYYLLLNTDLTINDSALIEFKDKTGKALLAVHLYRNDLETKPFLTELIHDSDNTHSPDFFIQQQVSNWPKESASFGHFYTDRPNGLQLINKQFSPWSKLAFYFRKHPFLPDSSLEYKLTGGEYNDTAWHVSGHLILVSRLQKNSNYSLQVRYKKYPANIEKYTFYVPPAWYQKRAFVFFALYPLGFLLIFFATVYIARLRLKKANGRKAKLALELKSIRAQLNPHFVFNALGSIQALINKNEIDLANQYLTDFSNLLRTSLKSHDSDLVPASVDLKTMENYIKLEQLRFRFQYDIKTDRSLNLDGIDIPSLLLQPLIENAIKHGIAPLKEAGRLSVSYTKKDDTLVITITDNGKGFNVHEIGDDKYGLRLTRERISLLNKTLKGQQVDMHIASSESGTVVTLTFNHWL